MIVELAYRSRRRAAAALLVAAAALTGCSGTDYKPTADIARSALERTLKTWQEGGQPGDLGGTPPVQAVDSTWQAGRKLSGFEVVSQEAGSTDQRFVVNLTHPNPDEKQEASYVVIGQNPVWIYRAEDYDRMINMDNNPAPPKTKRR